MQKITKTDKNTKLEKCIIDFIENNLASIKQKFLDPNKKKIQIDYSIEHNKEIIIKDKTQLEDYVIQWSYSSLKFLNKTKCQLTFFNLGSLLGSRWLLFSISLLYSYFFNLNFEDKKEKEIKIDILKCLEYIDNKDINNLTKIWNIEEITQDTLEILRYGKNYMINTFKEVIDDDIYVTLRKYGKFRIFIRKCWYSILWFFSFGFYAKISVPTKQKKIKNRDSIFEQIFNIIINQNDFFKKYNLFIMALDDKNKERNAGATFFGYHLEFGSNEMTAQARRLILDETDGFLENNDEDKTLYDFYTNRINELRNFFIENKDKIDKINKALNIRTKISNLIDNGKSTNEKKDEQREINTDYGIDINETNKNQNSDFEQIDVKTPLIAESINDNE